MYEHIVTILTSVCSYKQDLIPENIEEITNANGSKFRNKKENLNNYERMLKAISVPFLYPQLSSLSSVCFFLLNPLKFE